MDVRSLTARTARASNPSGTTAMRVRDHLDGLWSDEDFTCWYPRDGRPGLSPAQLATVCVLQFGTCDHRHMLAVRHATPNDTITCAAIAQGLPDYFTDDAINKITNDLTIHPTWVATDDDNPIGFAIVDRRSHHAAEILWIAVAQPLRGTGVGTLLLHHVLHHLAHDKVQVVEVKTLDASAGYQPYIATRAFWERRGFIHIDTIDPLPGWQPGNPAAIYIAALAPTR